MLDQMRSAAKSWVAKLFLGLLGVSFLIWGVPSSFLPQIGAGAIFSSGDSSVRASDYSFALRDTLVRRGISRLPSSSELRSSGIAAEVLLRLQVALLLDEEVRRMRLGADEDAALQLLRKDPLFHNINGSFDRNSFLNFLAQGGFSQAEVIENLQTVAKRDQLLDTVTTGLAAPDVFYQATLLYERERRSIDYVRLDPDHLGRIAPPDDDVLATWFETHGQEFRAPEYRTFTYMQLNAEMLAAAQIITDEQLQQYYEVNKERFAVPERREFAQLRFADRPSADQAFARLEAGEDFDKLVQEMGQEMADIQRGPLSRAELPSLMAAEIFALSDGQTSAVINDLAGPVIVRVSQIEPAQIPLREEIAETLRREMALAQANHALRQTMREIEDARFEGVTLSELAEQYGLKLETLTLDATGLGMDTLAPALPDIFPLRQTLLAQVFASQPGVDRDPLLGQSDYVWYQLDSITAARNLEFDEVRETAARDAWMAEESRRRLVERAKQLKAALQADKSLEQIAQENGLVVERGAGLQRVPATEFASTLATDVVAAVFATPTHGTEKAIDLVFPADERDVAILFQITDTAEPLSTDPQSLPEQQREMISARLSQDLVGQFLQQAMVDHAILQNESLLEEVLSDNNNTLSFR